MFKRALLAFSLMLFSCAASAAPITFSFQYDAADWPWIGRTGQSGTVTGTLFGLNDNGNGQRPTSIMFTSNLSGLGISNSTVNIFNAIDGAGFNLTNGVVTNANLLINFMDTSAGSMQMRFNYENYNVVHWNGGNGPIAGMGNGNGFAGAIYSAPASVPEPGSLALLGMGLIGLRAAARKRARGA